MLTIADNLSSYTLAAGEPWLMEIQLLTAEGLPTDIDDTALILSFYKTIGRTVIYQFEGERGVDESGQELFRYAFSGMCSEALLPTASQLSVEVARRYRNGRSVIATGTVRVASSAETVPSLDNGAIGEVAVRVKISASAAPGGMLGITMEYVAFNGGTTTPSPTPAPIFTSQPSITPSSGTAAVTAFTGSNGAATNTTSYTRRWLLSGIAIGTGATVSPSTAGNLVLEVTASGGGGSVTATSSAAAVLPAPTPAPTPTINNTNADSQLNADAIAGAVGVYDPIFTDLASIETRLTTLESA